MSTKNYDWRRMDETESLLPTLQNHSRNQTPVSGSYSIVHLIYPTLYLWCSVSLLCLLPIVLRLWSPESNAVSLLLLSCVCIASNFCVPFIPLLWLLGSRRCQVCCQARSKRLGSYPFFGFEMVENGASCCQQVFLAWAFCWDCSAFATTLAKPILKLVHFVSVIFSIPTISISNESFVSFDIEIVGIETNGIEWTTFASNCVVVQGGRLKHSGKCFCNKSVF